MEEWDFKEDCYKTLYREGIPYKVLSCHKPEVAQNVANKLHKMRKINEGIITNIDLEHPQIDLYKNTKYLLSEMKPNTGFEGLNKPKNVHPTKYSKIGDDGNLRAEWRDVFLSLNPRSEDISKSELDLLIHELAHTGCNHVTWRDDDHGEDFKKFEIFLFLNL